MVKSVDHESNTGSYVLCNSGVADIFLVLIPARLKYLTPMTTVPHGLRDFLESGQVSDHKSNSGSYVRWNTPGRSDSRSFNPPCRFKYLTLPYEVHKYSTSCGPSQPLPHIIS